ncbi:sensor domain-containing diguanylate cyclase [Qipengyuania aquimaris]|uniref:sensor domain-containing diguanylate cyclase n=1 Tax=Qipengyuania aquimaris TaxID=255984 RepID=UPI001CD42018|nr:sensor domain-containing diguanylate cyclase [Qipengyuania aquimaris]MCA0902631.1 diguanylate cyclase [Qipengyuania aquimaris]
MNRSTANRTETFVWPLAYSLAWLICAYIALKLTQGEDGIAAVWPSSGIFVASLLHLRGQGRVAVTIGVGIASLVANYITGVSLLACFGYTVANLAEGWLVFYLMGGENSRGKLLARPLNLLRFAGSAIIVSILSAGVAGILSANFAFEFLVSWATTVGLGMLIVAPFILFLVQSDEGRRRLASIRTVWALMLVAVASLVAFGQSEVPLLFLPVLAISIATAALGLSGAALSLLVVAVIGSILTVYDLGPVSGYFELQGQKVLFLQVYFLGLLVSALPVALMLTQRQNDLVNLSRSNRFLTAAEKAAKVGHWRYAPAEGPVYLSPETRRMVGSDAQPHTVADIAELFQDSDRKRVSHILVQALSTGVPFAFEARISGPYGEVFDTECRGEVEWSDDPEKISIFGTMMDITERANTMRALADARAHAERKAEEHQALAETDHLTGIANRRKILAVLEKTVLDARGTGDKVALAIVDVDHFKSVNDRFGHEAGDRTLQVIAKVLSERFDDVGVVGRLGGEEFLVVARGASASELDQRCTALRDFLCAYAWPVKDLKDVTLSIGIAELADGSSETEILNAADKALYFAKRGGRNRSVVFEGNLVRV